MRPDQTCCQCNQPAVKTTRDGSYCRLHFKQWLERVLGSHVNSSKLYQSLTLKADATLSLKADATLSPKEVTVNVR